MGTGGDAEQDEIPVEYSPSPAIDDKSPMDISSSGEPERQFTGNATPELNVENFPAPLQSLQPTWLVDRGPFHLITEGSYLFVLPTLAT